MEFSSSAEVLGPASPRSAASPPLPGRLARNGGWARRRGFAALLLLLLTGFCPPVVEGQPPTLFAPVNEPPPAGPDADLTLRSRMVTIDFAQLQRARAAVAPPTGRAAPATALSLRADEPALEAESEATLTLNLFADMVVTAIVEQTAPTFSGGYSVAGHLVDDPLGTLTLVVNGKTVAGTVRLPGETYHIRSVGGGRYAISEVEEPPLECGVGELHSESDHQH